MQRVATFSRRAGHDVHAVVRDRRCGTCGRQPSHKASCKLDHILAVASVAPTASLLELELALVVSRHLGRTEHRDARDGGEDSVVQVANAAAMDNIIGSASHGIHRTVSVSGSLAGRWGWPALRVTDMNRRSRPG